MRNLRATEALRSTSPGPITVFRPKTRNMNAGSAANAAGLNQRAVLLVPGRQLVVLTTRVGADQNAAYSASDGF
jgi:hypothetical protein